MNEQEKKLENIEINILLEALHQYYGYDFRSYSKASLFRRINNYMLKNKVKYPTELIPKLLHDRKEFKYFVYSISVPVTEMFRDPPFFRSLRENVVPFLKTFPYIKIWHAGCATGEEVYSMAIVLEEENFYKKSTIYATDFNDVALQRAKDGIYDLEHAREFTRNYQAAGGKKSFSEYYFAEYESMKIEKRLKKNLVFSNHNLTADGVFSEVQLILCRNVLIYFERNLQNKVLKLFTDSLAPGGILALGSKESLNFSEYFDKYDIVDKKWKIYKKKVK